MQDRFVISEEQIFKHLIHRVEGDTLLVRQNMQTFLHRVPQNIFKDEYHVLYECIERAYKYEIALTYDYFHQILTSNMEQILQNPIVTLYDTNDMTEVERQQNLLDHLLSAYDMLTMMEIEEDSPLSATLEFYLEIWCKQKMEEIVLNQLTILREGLTIGRRRYYGTADAKAYYDNAYNIIRSLDAGDADFISETIDTSTMTVEEIDAMLEQEADSPIVAKTGIDSYDELNEFRKGEILTIQAGTGVGKTRYCNNIVYNALQLGSNVLYLTLEQRSTRVWVMQTARHVLQLYGYKPDVTDKTVLRRSYNVEHNGYVATAKSDLVTNEQLGRLRLESLNLSAADFESKLINVWENGFHFDVVVIDYLGLLMTTGTSRYEALTDVVNYLKSGVKSFKGEGFFGVILNQLTKEAEQKIIAGNFETGKTEGSETQYLARASDYIQTLVQTPDDKLANKMRIYNDKVRLGDIPQPRIDAIAYMGHCYFKDYAIQNSLQRAAG